MTTVCLAGMFSFLHNITTPVLQICGELPRNTVNMSLEKLPLPWESLLNSSWVNRSFVNVNEYTSHSHFTQLKGLWAVKNMELLISLILLFILCVSSCYVGMTSLCLSWRKVLLSMTRFSWLACHKVVPLWPTTNPATSQAGVVSTVRPAAKSVNTQLTCGVVHLIWLYSNISQLLLCNFLFSWWSSGNYAAAGPPSCGGSQYL